MKRLVMAAALVVASFSTISLAQEKQPNAAEMLKAYAAALAGNGEQWSGYGAYASGQGNYLRGAAEVIRAEGEYIRMVAEARLAWARANLTEAEAAMKWQQVRHYTLMVDRLSRELMMLKRAESQAWKKMEKINEHNRSLSLVVHGKTNDRVFRAMRVMQMQFIPLSATNAVMTVAFPAIDASSFVANKEGAEVVGFPGGNFGQLWYFLDENDYSLEPWNVAHIAVMLSFQALGESLQGEVKLIQEYMAGVRRGVYDIWNPPGLPGAVKPSGGGSDQ